MMKEIQKFMQDEDENGCWIDCEDKKYMSETLTNWLEDGLGATERIMEYSEYLDKWV